ncbi:MAG: amino acid permease [Saprospiraceae bacterium]|nr:amino acid permease [Saprospiraceae bacterium]
MLKKLFRRKSLHLALSEQEDSHSLNKVLNVRDLTALGIAAIIGAGIFSTIGTASFEGGPGVVFLFIFTAIACGFAAFCYAEFASMVPVSGSAYTYSYIAFGELIAWIIGWALIMEYSVGNITVAISWSDYFCGFLSNCGIDLPHWMQMDWFTAWNNYSEASSLLSKGTKLEELAQNLQNGYLAYTLAPKIGSFHLVADLPALLIIFIITALVFVGMKESKNASNLMVIVKLTVVILVIIVGMFYINTENWSPFMPNGIGGVLKGVSAVFFAYIGFDALSTTAEECKNPQRDLPRGMLYSILICTILYILIALVLTGMVNYKELNVGDPLAYVFSKIGLDKLSGLVAVSAIFAMASVLLVFQLGQPRIWMSMSRDGLLPGIFKKLHPKYKTPSFSTLITGIVVAIPALFLNLTTVTDLCSIGTLFAFVLVCGGVLMLRGKHQTSSSSYKTPYINAKFILPPLIIICSYFLWTQQTSMVKDFLSIKKEIVDFDQSIQSLDSNQINFISNYSMYYDGKAWIKAGGTLELYLKSLSQDDFKKTFKKYAIPFKSHWENDLQLFYPKIPMWIWIITVLVLTLFSFLKNLSLIPIMGVISCLYMMAQIPLHNWIGFGVWLLVGLIIYFSYGYWNSRLAKSS